MRTEVGMAQTAEDKYKEAEKRAARARDLRYKRAALATMSFEDIRYELDEIQEACSEVQWMAEDEELLLSALEGNEDDIWEFKFAFSGLAASASDLWRAISDCCGDLDRFGLEFDDCLVRLMGNRYNLIGYDTVEEDYYSLAYWDRDAALSESGKRLMRLTKKDMLSTVGQCLGIFVAFLDLRYRYDYMKATFDVIRDGKSSILKAVRQIEKLYDEMQEEGRWTAAGRELAEQWDTLVRELPQRIFLE